MVVSDWLLRTIVVSDWSLGTKAEQNTFLNFSPVFTQITYAFWPIYFKRKIKKEADKVKTVYSSWEIS